MATNANSYMSSIASFLIIAMPIFSGTYDKYSQPELAKIISENSFVCMYLAYQLSKLVEMSLQVSQLLGVTYRINEMMTEMLKRSHDSDGSGTTRSGFSEARARSKWYPPILAIFGYFLAKFNILKLKCHVCHLRVSYLYFFCVKIRYF